MKPIFMIQKRLTCALAALSIIVLAFSLTQAKVKTLRKHAEKQVVTRDAVVLESTNQVLEWNQIFIDTLIATNTANSSSQRLGAIVHTAIFDAYNGVERRYTPIFV